MSVIVSQRALSLLRASVGTILAQDSTPQLVIPKISLVVFVMQRFRLINISEKELI